jgi:hypothetical protein
MEARELISRLCYLGIDNMDKKVYIMSEDGDNLLTFESFEYNGKIVLKPYDKKHGIKVIN